MAEASRTDDNSLTLRIKFKSESVDKFVERYAVDLSPGGIFIRTREPLAVGSKLNFEFTLIDGTPLMAGQGVVAWVREGDPSRQAVVPGMGIRFERLHGESQAMLSRLLAEKTKRQGAPQLRYTAPLMEAVRLPNGATAAPGGAAIPGAAAGPPPAREPVVPRPAPRAPTPAFGVPPAVTPPAAPPEAAEASSGDAWSDDKTEIAAMPPSFYFEKAEQQQQALDDEPGSLAKALPRPPAHAAREADDGDETTNPRAQLPARTGPPPAQRHPTPGAGTAAYGRSASPPRGFPAQGPSDPGGPHARGQTPGASPPSGWNAPHAETLTGVGAPRRTPTPVGYGEAPRSPTPFGGVPASRPATPFGGVDLPGREPGREGIPELSLGQLGGGLEDRPYSALQNRFQDGDGKSKKGLLIVGGVAALVVVGFLVGSQLTGDKPQQPTSAGAPAPGTAPSAAPSAAPSVAPSATAPAPTSGTTPEGTAPAAEATKADPAAPAVAGGKAGAPAKPEGAATEPAARPGATAAAKAEPAKPAAKPARPAVVARPAAPRPVAVVRPARSPKDVIAEAQRAEGGEPATGAPAPAPATTAPATEPGAADPAAVAEELYWLNVRSTPPGAEVLIDGQLEGKTPLQRRILDTGRSYAVTIRKVGFDPIERTIGSSDEWTKKGNVRTLTIQAKLNKAGDVGLGTPAAGTLPAEPRSESSEPKPDKPKDEAPPAPGTAEPGTQ